MAYSMNQVYALDTKFKETFENTAASPMPDKTRRFETLIRFSCLASVVMPVVYAYSLFNPLDPVHCILESLLEIEITTYSIFVGVFLVLEVWGVLCFAGIVLTFTVIVGVTLLLCEMWLEAATPVSSVTTSKSKWFRTKHLGTVPEEKLLWLYRSLQILTGHINSWLGNARMASVIAACLFIAVSAAFAIIRSSKLIFVDPSAVSLIGISLSSLVCATMLVYYECCLLDDLETKWQVFKSRLLFCSAGKEGVHKTAKSFRSISLKMAASFCNVNKSTFADWGKTGFDRIIDLLLTIG